ncbi:MAG: marine proteobacterial sortase target protein [Alphaproteobacteria bacterium]|nr:marine proteobacterial sortase target protein [Alphaproteobacteria bacterium]
MNHTSYRPSVVSEATHARHRIAFGTIAMGFALTVVMLVAMVAVARADTPTAPAGLFFKTELTDDIFSAPTLSSEVVIDISGEIARVNVRQRFRNPSKVWMEGVYVFPLPERSAVDRLVMHVGEREIEGRILEKQEAEQIYREAAAAGRNAALLSSARPNVFSTSVANIAPGAEIVVEIEYQDRVLFADGGYSYRFPLVVAPRYTPGREPALVVVPPQPRGNRWPELQRISHESGTQATAPRGRDLFGPIRNPGRGRINPVSLAVLLDAGVPVATLDSPNHRVAVTRDGETRAVVALAEGEVPADRDFVLNWAPVSGAQPQVGLFAETVGGAAHLVTSILPPDADSWTGETPPRDVVFILDKSGSMHGPAIAQAKQTIRLAISRLPKDARFNLVAFDSTSRKLFNGLRPANEDFVTRAFDALDRIEADGGTEMRAALEQAFDNPRDPKRLMQVVFLTDGAVSNERELFTLIERRLADARLFTVGIGPAPNSFFMRRAAEAGRGTFTYVDDPREIDAKVSALLRKLERPAVTDLRVSWNIPGDTPPETFPARVPDLYFGEPVNLATRFPGLTGDTLTGTLTITGRRGDAAWSREIDLSGLRPAEGAGAVWARARVAELQGTRGQTPGEREDTRARIVETALAYRLVTEFTSLVAVDEEEIARPDNEDLVTGEIERNLPDGMNFEKVFGKQAMGPSGMAPVAADMAQSAAFRQAVGLPNTATPAQRMALTGGLALLAALLLLLFARRWSKP